MLDHLALQCADVEAAAAFYTRVFAACGVREAMRIDHPEGPVVGPGRSGRRSRSCGSGRWKARQPAGAPGADRAVPARPSTRCSRAARAAGTEILHEPRVWPEYHPGYYGVFFRDPDGNNVEAVHHTFGLIAPDAPPGARVRAVVDPRRRLPGLSPLVPGLRRRRYR